MMKSNSFTSTWTYGRKEITNNAEAFPFWILEDSRTVFEALSSASKNKHLPAFERCQN